jgi:hypothetical protein
MKEWESGGRSDLKYIKKRKTIYEELNSEIWDWFCKARSKNMPVSGKLIQEKALVKSVEMGHDDFTASNGWLEAWQKRYGVKMAVLAGESADVPQEAVAEWAKRLPDIIKDYELKDIFNADETGLYYRALPARSMVIKGDSRRGSKTSKERVTALLAASAAGEKLKPLVIGKSENPRCFRGMDKSLLPVTYRNNKKAWMTSQLFREWLDKVNSQMRTKKRKILMFIDNCAAHPPVTLSHVKLVFLPPNTTSRLQPCDAGIIAAVKSQYRKRLLRHLLANMDECNSATELCKRVTIKDAIGWLSVAWTSVSESCIQKCFAKCGFRIDSDNTAEADEIHVPEQFQQLLGDMSSDDFVTMDKDTDTTAQIPDDWEKELSTVSESAQSDDSGDEDPIPTPTISSHTAMTAAGSLVDFAMSINDPAMMDVASKLQTMLVDYRVQKASTAVQKSIQDFFSSR